MYGVRTASGWLAEEATALSRCLHDSGDGINNGFSFVCLFFSSLLFFSERVMMVMMNRMMDQGNGW